MYFRDEHFTQKTNTEAQKEGKYSSTWLLLAETGPVSHAVHGNGDHGPLSKATFWYSIFGVSILADTRDAKAHHTLT